MARKCSNCGEVIDDDSLFCPECGSYTLEVSKNKRFPLKWALLATLFIILLAVAGLYFFEHTSKTDTSLTLMSNSKLDSSNEYSVQLRDSSKNSLAFKFISVKFGNDTYTLQTDRNGIASINLTVKDGSHEVKSYYKGDSKYNEAHSSDILVK